MNFPIRTAEELLHVDNPAWPGILATVETTQHPVQLLPANHEQGLQVLYQIQITTRSYLGALAYNCGGILVDDGWLRILGAGTHELPSLASVNGYVGTQVQNPQGYFIIAYDVLGGIFAIDGGGLGINKGEVCYLPPELGSWGGLGISHADFTQWAIEGDTLPSFYEGFRWSKWKEDTQKLNLSSAFFFYPPLSTTEGRNLETSHHSPVPISQLLGSSFLPQLPVRS
jgi:hypothetical protein